MINKKSLLLLFPSFTFILLAVGAILLFAEVMRLNDASRDRASRQKFDKFVQNVKSGKFQVTTDKWLESIKSEESLNQSERDTLVNVAIAVGVGGGFILVGVLFQFLAFSSARNAERAASGRLSGAV